MKYYEDVLNRADEDSKIQEEEYNVKITEMRRRIEELENENRLILSSENGNKDIIEENKEMNIAIEKYKDRVLELELKNKNFQSTVYIYY